MEKADQGYEGRKVTVRKRSAECKTSVAMYIKGLFGLCICSYAGDLDLQWAEF